MAFHYISNQITFVFTYHVKQATKARLRMDLVTTWRPMSNVASCFSVRYIKGVSSLREPITDFVVTVALITFQTKVAEKHSYRRDIIDIRRLKRCQYFAPLDFTAILLFCSAIQSLIIFAFSSVRRSSTASFQCQFWIKTSLQSIRNSSSSLLFTKTIQIFVFLRYNKIEILVLRFFGFFVFVCLWLAAKQPCKARQRQRLGVAWRACAEKPKRRRKNTI